MLTAVVKKKNIGRFCPVTNLYECSDGKFLLVTVKAEFDVEGSVEAVTGFRLPVSVSHAPRGTDVFLADERGRILDADDNAANGMTALAQYENSVSFSEALSRQGYELIEDGED